MVLKDQFDELYCMFGMTIKAHKILGFRKETKPNKDQMLFYLGSV